MTATEIRNDIVKVVVCVGVTIVVAHGINRLLSKAAKTLKPSN